MAFINDKHSGLANIAQRGLEEYTTVGREGEASGKVLPTNHGTSQNDIRKVPVT
jgi:hypothetical protein